MIILLSEHVYVSYLEVVPWGIDLEPFRTAFIFPLVGRRGRDNPTHLVYSEAAKSRRVYRVYRPGLGFIRWHSARQSRRTAQASTEGKS